MIAKKIGTVKNTNRATMLDRSRTFVPEAPVTNRRLVLFPPRCVSARAAISRIGGGAARDSKRPGNVQFLLCDTRLATPGRFVGIPKAPLKLHLLINLR